MAGPARCSPQALPRALAEVLDVRTFVKELSRITNRELLSDLARLAYETL